MSDEKNFSSPEAKAFRKKLAMAEQGRMGSAEEGTEARHPDSVRPTGITYHESILISKELENMEKEEK